MEPRPQTANSSWQYVYNFILLSSRQIYCDRLSSNVTFSRRSFSYCSHFHLLVSKLASLFDFLWRIITAVPIFKRIRKSAKNDY